VTQRDGPNRKLISVLSPTARSRLLSLPGHNPGLLPASLLT